MVEGGEKTGKEEEGKEGKLDVVQGSDSLTQEAEVES